MTKTRRVPKYRNETRWKKEPVYKDVPVYRTKYTYDIERWKSFRTERSSGHGVDVYWPDISRFRLTGRLVPGEMKESGRTEEYVLHLRDEDNEDHTYETSQREWKSFSDGESIIAMVNMVGVSSIKKLKLEKAEK